MILTLIYILGIIIFALNIKKISNGFWLNCTILLSLVYISYIEFQENFLELLLYGFIPFLGVNTVLYGWMHQEPTTKINKRFQVRFKTKGKDLVLNNIRRGVSIIGSAGSGKTESIVYPFLKHFSKEQFSGIIYDYKNFEITEMAYPLFKNKELHFHIISFDQMHARVNPIAPRYIPDVESVNEVSRVLLQNLLELKDTNVGGSTQFFHDAAEGLLGALIWKLKTSYPKYCTLPHLITIYQRLDAESLISFIGSNQTSRALASAFLLGKDSERQTAGVLSSLANALKKISTERIFYVLSSDETSLDINNPENPSVISVVNNPKYESAYAPVIALIIHTIIKQMSIRNQRHSFVLLEEAPTIRLLNMHRIPATLRSYDIATIYVLQDKVQNDLLYGDKASRAILSNLSYQFFGKVNDPETARYYERFFEIIKKPTKSISKTQTLNFDTRITKGEKEVSKIRSVEFFRLQQGEFIAYADGIEKRIRFNHHIIVRDEDLLKEKTATYYRTYYKQVESEAASIFSTHTQIR